MLGQSNQVLANELTCQPTVFATSAANVLISHRGNVGLAAIDNELNCQPTIFATSAANVMIFHTGNMSLNCNRSAPSVQAGQITITITE